MESTPKKEKVTFKYNDKTFSVDYAIGETLKEAITLHGEKAVYDLFFAKAKIKVQDTMRGLLKENSFAEAKAKFEKDFSLDTKPRTADPEKKAEKAGKVMHENLLKLDVKSRAAVIRRMYGVAEDVAMMMAKGMEPTKTTKPKKK